MKITYQIIGIPRGRNYTNKLIYPITKTPFPVTQQSLRIVKLINFWTIFQIFINSYFLLMGRLVAKGRWEQPCPFPKKKFQWKPGSLTDYQYIMPKPLQLT